MRARILRRARVHVLVGFCFRGAALEAALEFACYGECAVRWPPYFAPKGKLRVGNGVKRSLLGTVARKNGRRQVTYAGRPLYFYVGDTGPGVIRCQNAVEFGGRWLLVRPSGAGNVFASLVLLGTTSAWAAGSLYARGAPLPKNPLRAASMQMLAASVIAASVGLIRGEPAQLNASSFGTHQLLAFAYLVVFGSLVAFSAYAWLLKNVRISTVATYAFVNPVVAVALGAAFLGEPITPTTLAAGAAIVLAVVLIVIGKVPLRRMRVRAQPATLSP